MDTEALRQRVTHLERANRRWRWIAALGLAGVATAGLAESVKPPVADVVTAHQFVLVDAEGKPRARLRVEENGSATLNLADTVGRDRLALLVAADGSQGVAVIGKEGTVRTLLAVTAQDAPLLALYYYEDGRPAVRLAVPPDGSPSLAFMHRRGDPFWTVP